MEYWSRKEENGLEVGKSRVATGLAVLSFDRSTGTDYPMENRTIS